MWAGLSVRVRGRENILNDRPQIFFCNHQSYFDVFCLLAYLPAQYRWLAKEELFHIPVFGRSMALAGYVSIDRSNPRKALRSMEAAAGKIRSVLIGTHRILPKGSLRIGRGPLEIRIGKPLPTVGLHGRDKTKLLAQISEAMAQLLAESTTQPSTRFQEQEDQVPSHARSLG
jgi:1-acyl-sn-glycerol-3-phosphate acyltransferase